MNANKTTTASLGPPPRGFRMFRSPPPPTACSPAQPHNSQSVYLPTGLPRRGIGVSQRSAGVTSLKCDIIKASCCCGQAWPEGSPSRGPLCLCISCVCGLKCPGLLVHVHFGELMRSKDGPGRQTASLPCPPYDLWQRRLTSPPTSIERGGEQTDTQALNSELWGVTIKP